MNHSFKKIKNWESLAVTEERQTALQIAEAGLLAIDTKELIRANVSIKEGKLKVSDKEYDLRKGGRIVVVGIGKCAVLAGEALEEVLGDNLSGGIIFGVMSKDVCNFKKLKCFFGTHPAPSEDNIRASNEILTFLQELNENDTVIFIISGGGSTLLCLPKTGTCEDEAAILKELFNKAADIHEINTLRKHLSLARGGRLAAAAYPAEVISLLFSDVPGNDISTISSGPTVFDETTVEDGRQIYAKYNLPISVELIETPKEKKYFEKIKNILFVSNQKALEKMAEKAKSLGLTPEICTDCLFGEARVLGPKIVEELKKRPSKTALLYGGETTVTVTVRGEGGRNRELALAALPKVSEKELLLAIASDGRDNGDAAGAVSDIITVRNANKKGMDAVKFLNDNQSAAFFRETASEILTGPTGSNVSDLIVAIKF